jgi:hypothetical protein
LTDTSGLLPLRIVSIETVSFPERLARLGTQTATSPQQQHQAVIYFSPLPKTKWASTQNAVTIDV